MDMSLQKEEYTYLEKGNETLIEECVEAELSLPEYMPEILRIIKSSADAKINSVSTVGERVTVDGVCELRMIYAGDDGGIYSFSQSRNFTRYSECESFLSAADITAKATVSYVNCRATNQKRAEIKAGIAICLTAYCAVKEEVVSLGESKCIEEKSVPVSAMSLGCRKSRNFSMSETFSVESGAAFIISTKAVAIPTETRKISNKVMIKGDAIVEIAYVPVGNKETVEHIKKSLPINQILEFEGMDERFTGDIVLNVSAADAMIKSSSSGESNEFDVALGIDASVTMWESKEFFVISDAYAVGTEVSLTRERMKFYSALDEIRDTYIFKDSIDASKTGVQCILDVSGELGEVSAEFKNSVFIISGTLKLSYIYKDGSGGIVTLDKILDYRYERKALQGDCNIWCMPQVALSSLDCQCKNGDTVDVRAELQIICTVFEEQIIDAVVDITECEGVPTKSESAITVYFPEKDESLWEIARRYKTSVSAVAAENDLDGETTADCKMIFIPTL